MPSSSTCRLLARRAMRRYPASTLRRSATVVVRDRADFPEIGPCCSIDQRRGDSGAGARRWLSHGVVLASGRDVLKDMRPGPAGLAGLIVLAVLLTVWGTSVHGFRNVLRERALDAVLPLSAPADALRPAVTIVDIDRDTLARFGPGRGHARAWPGSLRPLQWLIRRC